MNVHLLPFLALLLAVVSVLALPPPFPRNVDVPSITTFWENVDYRRLLPRQDECAPPPPPPGAPPPPWPPPAIPPPWLPATCPWPPPTPPWISSLLASKTSSSTSTSTSSSTSATSTITSPPILASAVPTGDNTVSNQTSSKTEIPIWGVVVIALASVAVALAAVVVIWWCQWNNQHNRAPRQQEVLLFHDEAEISSPDSSSSPSSTTAAAAIKARYLASVGGDGSDPDRNSLPPGHPLGQRVPSIRSFVSGGTLLSMGAALTTPRGARITRTTLPVTEEHQLRHRAASVANSDFTASTGVMFAPMALSDNGHPIVSSEPILPANMGIPP